MKGQTNFMSFRACVYPSPDEEGAFIAHCLELDVIGVGDSVEEALSELLEVIETQLEACQETGAQLPYFAPEDVWKRYNEAQAAGRKIADELVNRIVSGANRRLGHIFDNVVGSRELPHQCLATA